MFWETHRELQMVGLRQSKRCGMDLGRWEQRADGGLSNAQRDFRPLSRESA